MTSSKPSKGYSRFVFMNDVREHFLKQFRPKYPRVLADHVTHEFGVTYDHYMQDLRTWTSRQEVCRFYGYLNSGDGLECFLVDIDSKKFRPDGRPYHITWSLRPDRYKPAASNTLIQYKKCQPLESVHAGMTLTWKKL